MSRKRILITGGSGLLGQYLNLELHHDFDILTLYNTKIGNCLSYNSARIDLSDFAGLKQVVNDFQPDFIIHTAAISNQAAVESTTRQHSFRMNVSLTALLAELSSELGATMVYTSTDLVYAGYRGSFLKEDAKLVPLTLYAETKLMGEVKVQSLADNYIILRTALLYGYGLNGTTNFFQEMVANLMNKKKVDVFTDQYRTPLSLREAARIMKVLLNSELKNLVINYAGATRVSRADMAEIACREGGFSMELLNKISMADKPGVVPVADVSMDSSIIRHLGYAYQPFEESIHEAIVKIKNHR